MQRYIVSQFDVCTFVVVDQKEQREVCICSNYNDWTDAEERAKNIALLLNQNQQG